ncbi:MAG: HrgA protein, partial [Sphaerochaetaceae bacterium]|nr:HrgA protein [Sphaerochaetaceae bacterium]MDD4397683.1 HrgA protein [Sphaerochaetaceae bacterium]
YHEILDWDTINRLAGENADFNDFIKAVHQDALVDGKIHKEYYDKVMDEDSIREYSVKKHIL